VIAAFFGYFLIYFPGIRKYIAALPGGAHAILFPIADLWMQQSFIGLL